MARLSPYGKKNFFSQYWIHIASAVFILCVIFLIGYRASAKKQTNLPQQQTAQNQTIAEPEIQQAKTLQLPQTTPEPAPQPPQLSDQPAAQQEPNSLASNMIDQALKILNTPSPDMIQARDILNEVLKMQITEQQTNLVKSKLTELSDIWLFSKQTFQNDTLCKSYLVKPGDLLTNIGKNQNTPWEIIAQINQIQPSQLKAGQKIKVINGPFHLKIYRSTFTMDIYLQNTYVKTLPVGLGKQGYETPTGLWRAKVGGKMISPTWTDPDTQKRYEPEDPDYPLGSRWIGLEGLEGPAKDRTGFAIHGTKDPQEIGDATSRGCIRLHNGNAVLVYNLMTPGLSYVRIVE